MSFAAAAAETLSDLVLSVKIVSVVPKEEESSSRSSGLVSDSFKL